MGGTHAGARGKPVDDSSAKHIDGKPVDCVLRAYFFLNRSARHIDGKPVGDGSAKHIDGKPVDCALRAYLFFKTLRQAP